MTPQQIDALDWNKNDGLLPAIVQDADTGTVLMLGYVNRESLQVTLDTKRVTFFSRSKQRLWTKGETSNHFLNLVSVAADCDQDTLLITAHPQGPTCHTGTESCFGDAAVRPTSAFTFLDQLEAVIEQRLASKPEGSYTAKLWSEGITRIAQKVGEEGVEVALASVTATPESLTGEAADLIFHLALLLKARDLTLGSAVAELQRRHVKR